MNGIEKSHNSSILPAYLLFLSITLSSYNINVGFALKPYMIIIAVCFVLRLNGFRFYKLRTFEVVIFVFYIYYCSTGLFAKYPEYSIRLILGIIITLTSYIVMKDILSKVDIMKLEKIISSVGIIFNLTSIILYAIGMYFLHFNFIGNQIRSYGVLVDRSVPRLIGTFDDPNIFSFCNFVFFFYYLTHIDSKKSKLGLLLTTSTLLLTFSRGAILAVLLGLFMFFIFAKVKTKIKMVTSGLVLSYLLIQIANFFLSINIWDILTSRFESSANDNGSGRFTLWENGISLFKDHPVFGIGLFNFRPYNSSYFGSDRYMHNTFLEVLTESGLIGLTLYLIIFLLLAIDLYKGRKKGPDIRYLFFTLCSMIVLLSSLSMIINEVFFLFIALIWRYLLERDRVLHKSVSSKGG
ncbi:O-antigen ligase family protein [Priestia endophytica]|uniref:O-antigen ligase family protein n=1 Tax=Priestia endophytica TaxID=135735 RepID=UPI0022812EC8|nr:O-antigen ligase family protein [Priestia endophytica]MCY8232281.1 O-antigen ligase family protein [Priestia endophytica]